jgi:hypothetical protein
MPKKNPHPHVAWRDGRPRFSPGRDLRAHGFKGTDLRWPEDAPAAWHVSELKPGDANTGRWFTRGEAVDWSEAFRRSLEERRKAAARPKGRPARPAVKVYSVAQMLEDWQRAGKWQEKPPVGYSENTKRDYRQKMRIVEEDHPLIYNAPVSALEQPTVRSMFEEIWSARGLASANGAVRVLSSAISWAMLRGKARMKANPALKIQMELPPPRIRFATRKEIATLIAAADAKGWPWAGDMVVLGVWTGQRQADRLAMVNKGMLSNRRIFRQRKTGAVVAVRDVP